MRERLGAKIVWLGTLGGNRSEATGVSADGRVVVGWSYDGDRRERAFRWTEADGMRDLGTLGGRESRANAVSADGSVIVGWAKDVNGNKWAFRWQNGVMRSLGTLNGDWSEALSVSADGKVVVGLSHERGFIAPSRAFYWTASAGMRAIEGEPDRLPVMARDVSADGRVVVGIAQNYAGGKLFAYRWTLHTGLQFADIREGIFIGITAVSADGRIVVGWVGDEANAERMSSRSRARAFRWATEGIQYLGQLGGSASIPCDISADGRIVVGWATGSEALHPRRAFRWSAQTGMQDLNTLYSHLLRDELRSREASRLIEARAVAANGRFIVGVGFNAEKWREEAFLLSV